MNLGSAYDRLESLIFLCFNWVSDFNFIFVFPKVSKAKKKKKKNQKTKKSNIKCINFVKRDGFCGGIIMTVCTRLGPWKSDLGVYLLLIGPV
jgi:hypothetical protein